MNRTKRDLRVPRENREKSGDDGGSDGTKENGDRNEDRENEE